MEQHIIHLNGCCDPLDEALRRLESRHLFLVCGKSLSQNSLGRYFSALEDRMGIKVTVFGDFSQNPGYESVVCGIKAFRRAGCDLIVGAGGGSAMDVAKCIKLWAQEDLSRVPIGREIAANSIPLMLAPTTAGTGSEVTRYAVIYYEGKKQSITHDSILPEWVVYAPSVLATLPLYQRHATMMDALCHATESFWSVNSNDISREWSARAIAHICAARSSWLSGEPDAAACMLEAAAEAGRAINITQTTAGHAMCYKLCALSGISHGHAAALCVRSLWPYMLAHTDDCIDPRGAGALRDSFARLAQVFGAASPEEGPAAFAALMDNAVLTVPSLSPDVIDELAKSVNPVRLDEDAIRALYREILRL